MRHPPHRQSHIEYFSVRRGRSSRSSTTRAIDSRSLHESTAHLHQAPRGQLSARSQITSPLSSLRFPRSCWNPCKLISSRGGPLARDRPTRGSRSILDSRRTAKRSKRQENGGFWRSHGEKSGVCSKSDRPLGLYLCELMVSSLLPCIAFVVVPSSLLLHPLFRLRPRPSLKK